MYHVELRQFPHNFCRFNLEEAELRATILEPWARGEWIEQGERKWSPAQAKLTVLEGPRLEVQEISMGRGWRNASRHSEDVTERLLASERRGPSRDDERVASREAASGPAVNAEAAAGPAAGARDVAHSTVAGEALAAQLVALLGDDPAPLMRAWRLALERHPDRTPSECLALAEDFIRR